MERAECHLALHHSLYCFRFVLGYSAHIGLMWIIRYKIKDMHIIVCLPWEKIARVYDFPEFRRRREADLRY